MTLAIDVDGVLADLRELHERFGGPDGAPARSRGRRSGRPRATGCCAKLEDLPVTVERDPAGNIWATLPGAGETEGFVIVGSHIDAVPAGGWLDGALGLLAALGVVRALAAADAPPPVEVRIVDWADEEGARFGRSLLGSSAAAGTLDPDDVRDLLDSEGTRLQDALAACGVDLDAASGATASLRGRAGLRRAAHRAGAGPAGLRPPRVGGQRHGRRWSATSSRSRDRPGTPARRRCACAGTRSPPPRAPRSRSARSASATRG